MTSKSRITTEKYVRNVRPTSPGEILKEEFLTPLEMTQAELAAKIGCDVKTINRICNDHIKVTTAMAISLGKVFDTDARFWINLQTEVDLWDEKQSRIVSHRNAQDGRKTMRRPAAC